MPPDTIYFCSVSKKHGRGGYMYAIFSPFRHLKQLIILINRVVQRCVIESKQYSKSSCFFITRLPIIYSLFCPCQMPQDSIWFFQYLSYVSSSFPNIYLQHFYLLDFSDKGIQRKYRQPLFCN